VIPVLVLDDFENSGLELLDKFCLLLYEDVFERL
jgi:hypothetical protein